MRKLEWKRDFSYEGTQEKGNTNQWWKASWFVLFFHVFSLDGKWGYFIYGNNTLKSNPDKMFASKEDAFDAVELRLQNAFAELASKRA